MRHDVTHYHIIEMLGEGGMGEVYKAEDLRLRRIVALKFLPEELTRDAESKLRLIQEAQAASVLDHPNICTIYDVDETPDGVTFISMAFYEGKTLRDRIANGRLGPEEAINIAIQIAHGLVHAHAHGIVHRDIKPANIIVSDDGDVKILDFGLAKLAGQLRLTTAGKTPGTAAYMSPEQVRGENLDSRTDIWSLGAVVYEMLSGKVAFRGDFEQAIMYAIVNDEPAPLAAVRPDIPAELADITAKALAKNRLHRYPQAKELLDDLGHLKRKLERERDPVHEGWHFSRHRRPYVVAATVVVLATLLVIAAYRARPRRDQGLFAFGQPRQVTSGDVWHDEPALSPDGGRIAYTSDVSGNRDLHVIDVRGGNPYQLTQDPAADSYPAWFPDGTELAFVSDRPAGAGIWRIGQFGGGATLLVKNASDPAVSPDGSRIAFTTPELGGEHRIGVARLANPREVTILTGDLDGLWDHRTPAWSPDGRTICYATQHDLWLVAADGGKARRLSTGGVWDSDPAWSRDGKHIYFSSYRGNALALWRIDAEGGTAQRLTPGSGCEHNPNLCADDTRLVYASQTTQSGMYIRDLGSGQETKLPGLREDCFAALAPDGGAVVYATDRGGATIDLWLQALDRGLPVGTPQHLTADAVNASWPAFSPDGKWLAYYRIDGEQRDIYTIPTAGGSPNRVTADAAVDFQPAWAPDGTKLAFSSNRTGTYRIWWISLRDGMPTAAPTCITADTLGAYAPAWSPDGEEIAFIGRHGGSNDIWVVPAQGNLPARRVTTGAEVKRVKWDPVAPGLLASGSWGQGLLSLARVSPDGGAPTPLDPPLLMGSLAALATFDFSLDGRLLVFSREDLKGNIWVLETGEHR